MPLTLSGTNGVSGVDGTASTPANRGSDTNTGIVYGTDTVQIATGGTTAVTVDSSQNVGIGTASPVSASKLTVSGSLSVNSSDGNFSAGGVRAFMDYDAAGPAARIGALNGGTGTNPSVAFYTSNTERARIDSSGNLLVGTTSSPTGAITRITATPTSKWAIDCSENSVSIANGGNATFPAGSGLIVATNPATGATAVYVVGGGNATLLNTAGSEWVASTTSPAAGKFSVAYSGSLYAIYNNYGSTQTFNVALIRTRTSV